MLSFRNQNSEDTNVDEETKVANWWFFSVFYAVLIVSKNSWELWIPLLRKCACTSEFQVCYCAKNIKGNKHDAWEHMSCIVALLLSYLMSFLAFFAFWYISVHWYQWKGGILGWSFVGLGFFNVSFYLLVDTLVQLLLESCVFRQRVKGKLLILL